MSVRNGEAGIGGRTALVTGAWSGIGRAIAETLADAGAVVLAVDKVNDIAGQPPPGCAAGLTCDVSDDADVDRLGAAISAWSPPSILVNAAGIMRVGTADAATMDDWDTTFNINVRGPWLLCRLLVGAMASLGGGAIVNVSSGVGLRPTEALAVYSASKAALIGLTRAMAVDYAPQGIRVNAICPGVVDTPLFRSGRRESVNPTAIDTVLQRYPMNRFGTVEEMASVVRFLVSDSASYLTGAAIPVDGGRTLH